MGYKVIQAKISESSAKQLDIIVERYGFKSRYEIVQLLISAFIKHAGLEQADDTAIPRELCRIFEGFESDTNRVITCAPSPSNVKIREILCVYERNKRCKDMVRYRFNSDGTLTSTRNVANIFKSFISLAFPQLEQILKELGAKLGYEHYDDTLMYLIGEAKAKISQGNDDDIRDEFSRLSDAEDHVEIGNVPVQTRTKNIEKL